MSTKSEQFEWRRSKVVEMRARGMTHQEIAHELQVSKTAITSDIQYLRSQAKEYLKYAFEILETSEDNRERLHCLDLFKDTHTS